MHHQQQVSNRLIHESSPYLLQHAGNPVNWLPWSKEAFEQAMKENKPVFLSIGYSTCHWCHVMAHESFEDPEVASYLNQHFISIKVDREERPDVDAVYMQVCQAMTGSGGWPLTIFMTPDQHPFFAGTYFPKASNFGQPGFMHILKTIVTKWQQNPEALKSNGLQITQAFSQAAIPAPGKMTRELMNKAKMDLDSRFDEEYGGFTSAPKFPTPHVLMFLTRFAVLNNDKRSMHMLSKTLTSMFKGGIFDHLGGGFSRYSTDRKWLIPHFEKMLYDNALLAIAYTEAYQVTGKTLFRRVATATLDYLLREMTSPEGGFYSAQDADTSGQEGAYYTFTPSQVENVLGQAEGKRFCQMYGVTEKGVLDGKSIINRLREAEEEEENLRSLTQQLYEYRKSTRKLFTDDKILSEWNGYAITAFCKAAYAFCRPDYLAAAQKAMAYAREYLLDGKGGVYAWRRNEKTGGRGSLSDHAAMAWASLTMYQMEFDNSFAKQAEEICRCMVNSFFDDKQGDFYLSQADAGLIFRPKEHYDGAVPSGNALAAYVLNQLSHLTLEDAWKEYATRTLERIAGHARNQPTGYCFGLIAGLDLCFLPVEALCLAAEETDIHAFARAMGRRFLPHATIAAKQLDTPEKDAPAILKGRDAMGRPAAYFLCEKGTCHTPVYNLSEMEALLASCCQTPLSGLHMNE